MSEIPVRPAWVEVDLDAVENNAWRLKQIIGDEVELMAMVKANAYGHGAVECSMAAAEANLARRILRG